MTRTAEDERRGDGAEGRRHLSGLEYMRQLLTGERKPSGMARLMNMRLVEVEEGRAVFAVEPDERHYKGLGIAHGAWRRRCRRRSAATSTSSRAS